MADFKLVRVPNPLAERIDGVRGSVPRERWVRETLERVVSGEEPAPDHRARPLRVATPSQPKAPRVPSDYELPKIAPRSK